VMTFKQELIAFLVTSELLVESQRILFDHLWKSIL
jgi:hypothetical protein